MDDHRSREEGTRRGRMRDLEDETVGKEKEQSLERKREQQGGVCLGCLFGVVERNEFVDMNRYGEGIIEL